MERILSYSQFYEDLILYHALKEVKEGFYIDCGANDPIQWSVTKLFSNRGWRGVNIEPLVDKWNLLMLDRTNDINLNCGVSDKNGKLNLMVCNDYSTFDVNLQKKLELRGGGV